MFRIAAIVILSAATVLTGVGWVCSHVVKSPARGCRLPAGAPEWETGWFYDGADDYPFGLVIAYGIRGEFRTLKNFRPSSVLSWLPSRWECGPVEIRVIGDRDRVAPANLALGLICPFWIPFVVFAAYPAYAIATRWVRPYRRRRAGKCVACGYSLIGNTSGRCPECGQYPDHEDSIDVKGDE
jgi:hypothetical protein